MTDHLTTPASRSRTAARASPVAGSSTWGRRVRRNDDDADPRLRERVRRGELEPSHPSPRRRRPHARRRDRRLHPGGRPDRAREDRRGRAESPGRRRPGRRLHGKDRHPGLRRHAPAHVARAVAEQRARRPAPRLPPEGPDGLRAQPDAGGGLSRRPHRRVLGDERRGHDHPRLVAHQHDACAHRRRDRGAARVGDPRRLWLRPQLLPPEPRDQPVPERHLPAPEPVLLVRGSAADPGARRCRAAVRRSALRRHRVEHRAPSRHRGADQRARRRRRRRARLREAALGRARGRRPSRPRVRHHVHPLVHAHRPGAGSRSRTRAGASRSPARSSCRWGTGCHRSRRRSTATSRSA